MGSNMTTALIGGFCPLLQLSSNVIAKSACPFTKNTKPLYFRSCSTYCSCNSPIDVFVISMNLCTVLRFTCTGYHGFMKLVGLTAVNVTARHNEFDDLGLLTQILC